jgi:hypothetical protein
MNETRICELTVAEVEYLKRLVELRMRTYGEFLETSLMKPIIAKLDAAHSPQPVEVKPDIKGHPFPELLNRPAIPAGVEEVWVSPLIEPDPSDAHEIAEWETKPLGIDDPLREAMEAEPVIEVTAQPRKGGRPKLFGPEVTGMHHPEGHRELHPDGRACPSCGKPIERRLKVNGHAKNEDRAYFLTRKFCNLTCVGAAKMVR